MATISQQIAEELNVKSVQIEAAVSLLDEGATVPFIARYRKEATQGLDDNHLRFLAQRLVYLRELNERKQVVKTNIKQQGKLTDSLSHAIDHVANKTQLEDLYLPFKPKRRTKGQIAIEAGIEPLAKALFKNTHLDPEQEAKQYIKADKGFADVKAVLEGASFILIEYIAEQPSLVQKLRRLMQRQGQLTATVVKGKTQEGAKYRDYFEHSEKLTKVPSHRALAMLRGRNEGFLQLSISIDPEGTTTSSAEQLIHEHFNFRLTQQKGAAFIQKVIRLAWKTKLNVSLENESLGVLREQAEKEAIKVFAKNLSDLLMAAPAGEKVTLGLDPGLRTGCKLAVVDGTGKLLSTNTIFPHAPQNNWDKSMRTIVNLCKQHKVSLIAIGNGTGSRESDKLVAEAIKILEKNKPMKVMVSEAGASVYSASEFAAAEFSDLDVSLRGAVSIARRLQDPLAELVKIDPKAIGVGQYQHDVSQSLLSQSLDDVIEDCVNKVGVDLNQASMPLLARVSGLNKTIAQNIVIHREEHGRFEERKQLLKVARLGPKAFEQSAGFLRIREGKNPLDMSGVHPETYPLVEKIIQQLSQPVDAVIGQTQLASKVNKSALIDANFGEITVDDVIHELEKPGRDPRPEFKTATFQEGVEKISDLKVGMILEGVISNVANFGAFVDIGVHQDGLVHISAITDKYISDPREVVKAGDIVKVKVLEVDSDRKRINLTMRLTDKAPAKPKGQAAQHSKPHGHQNKQNQQNRPKHKSKPKPVGNEAMGNAFADAFAKLKK